MTVEGLLATLARAKMAEPGALSMFEKHCLHLLSNGGGGEGGCQCNASYC